MVDTLFHKTQTARRKTILRAVCVMGKRLQQLLVDADQCLVDGFGGEAGGGGFTALEGQPPAGGFVMVKL